MTDEFDFPPSLEGKRVTSDPTGNWRPPNRRWRFTGTRLDGTPFTTTTTREMSLGTAMLYLVPAVDAHEIIHLTVEEVV